MREDVENDRGEELEVRGRVRDAQSERVNERVRGGHIQRERVWKKIERRRV